MHTLCLYDPELELVKRVYAFWNLLRCGRNDADLDAKYSRPHTSSFRDSFLQ